MSIIRKVLKTTAMLTLSLVVLFCIATITGCSSKTSNAGMENFTSSEYTRVEISANETLAENSISKNEKINFETIPKKFVLKSGVFKINYTSDGEATIGEEGKTLIFLENDGSFTGNYYSGLENGKGLTGTDYSKGTAFICNFKGKFSKPEQIDEYTYSMKLISLETEGTVGEKYYENGIKYIYSSPYGIGNVGDGFILYLPGVMLKDLQDALVSCYKKLYTVDDSTNESSLMHYCFYNYRLNKLCAFFGEM